MNESSSGRHLPESHARASQLPVAVRRMGDSGRLAMTYVLGVLEHPPPTARRWWVIGSPESVSETDPDLVRLWMEPYPELPELGEDVTALVEEIPTVPEARAQRVVSAVGMSLFAVEYPSVVRWHSVLPARLRAQLLRP